MGYHVSSGPYVVDQSSFGSSYADAASVITFLKNALQDADWNLQQEIEAQITLAVLAIVHGVTITIAGVKFAFWWPPNSPPTSGIPVEISMSMTLAEILAVFAQAVADNTDFTATIDGTDVILTGLSNNDLCEIFPTGGFGTWNSTTGTPGQGFAHHGGVVMNSAEVNGETLDISIFTLATSNLVMIQDVGGIGEFAGCLFSGKTWRIAASQYQFVLWCPGETASGHLLIVSNTYPADGMEYFQFICGPVESGVGSTGGDRSNFGTFSERYYVATKRIDGSNIRYFSDAGAGSVNQRPTLVYPGYGRGISPVDKLGNKIGGNQVPVIRNGTALPFDAFLAVSENDPGSSSETVKIFGQLWDTVIFSKYDAIDTACQLNGKEAIVIVSQDSTVAISAGSFVLRIEE